MAAKKSTLRRVGEAAKGLATTVGTAADVHVVQPVGKALGLTANGKTTKKVAGAKKAVVKAVKPAAKGVKKAATKVATAAKKVAAKAGATKNPTVKKSK